MKNLFCLKSKIQNPACAIYEYTCKENYIGEAKGNVEFQCEEHSEINKISEPSFRHLLVSIYHH